MKKVLIVANLSGFVGFLWNDIHTLQSMGYQVDFAATATKDSGALSEKFSDENVRFIPLHFSSKHPFDKENVRAFFELRRIIKLGKYDVVHCHTPIVGFFTRVACAGKRRKGLKVIYTTHGFSFTHYSSRKEKLQYYYLEKIASLFTDAIITINHEDYVAARKMWCSNVNMINGVGVDTEFYHSVDIDVDAYKRNLGLPLDKILVLSVGELSARKNHQIIIKAVGSLPNKNDYIYVICGKEVENSGMKNKLEAEAEKNNVSLYLLGHRKDIPEIMHCSDIGAIPSVREGLGLAGIQSLCAMVPLVGTNVQGIKDYVIENETGCLCDPYDVEGFAEAIKYLSDKDIRNSMSEKCYAVAKRYDTAISKKQMSDIYKNVLT